MMGKVKSLFSKVKNFILSHKKPSIFLIIIFIVIVIAVFPKGSKLISAEEVSYRDIVKTVSVTGKIDSENSVNLTFQSGGRLIYVGAKEGDDIKLGQAIASLDKTQLEASLRQAQQDFTAAKAASERYYDNHNDTESFDQKVQRTALDATQNKAYDQMIKVQQDLNNSTLYSPIDGILTRADAKSPGINVTPATVFTVTDPTSLIFKMEVDEADIGLVKIGLETSVSLDAFPNDNIKLKIEAIDFVSHTTSSGGNAFYVKAKIPELKNYRIGMSGNADIIIDSRKNVLSIPASSIFNDNYVYVKINNKLFEKRKVELGLQNDTTAQVLSGVSDKEMVALDPGAIPSSAVKK